MEFIFEYWIQFFFGIIISISSYLFHRVKKEYKTLETIRRSICTLLYANMVDILKNVNDQDEICIYDKERFNQFYLEYKKLNCDREVDDLKQQIDKKIIQ